MQSYVINIYRVGDKKHPGALIGVLTDPCTGQERRFADLAELHRLVDEVVHIAGGKNTKS